MKIYSSELLNETEVNSGQLDITADDLLIIRNAGNGDYNADRTGFDTAPTQGLYIPGGTFDHILDTSSGSTETLNTAGILYHYIDGKGQQQSLNDVLVANGSLSGTNLQLSNRAGHQIVADIDLSGLGGGATGGGAETNPSNNDLPVKWQNDLAQNVFVDSMITEIASDGSTATVPTTASAQVNGAVTTGNMVSFDNVAGGNAAEQGTFHTRFSAGVANTTIIIAGTEYTGTLTSTVAGAEATFELASGDFTGTNELANDADATLPNVAGNRSNLNTVRIEGNLEVAGTSTQIDSTTVTLSDRFIQLATPNANVGANDSGFLAVTGRASDTNRLQGIRYHVASQSWQVSTVAEATGVTVNASGVPSQASDWASIQTAVSGINKLVANFSDSTSMNAPTVSSVLLDQLTLATPGNSAAALVGTDGNTNDKYLNFRLDSTAAVPAANGAYTVANAFNHTDVTVQIFEGNSQIIPDEIILGQIRLATGALQAQAGGITITLPRTAALGTLKVVIVG